VFLWLGLEAWIAVLLLRRTSDQRGWILTVLSASCLVHLGVSLDHDQSERRYRQSFLHNSAIVRPADFKLGHNLIAALQVAKSGTYSRAKEAIPRVR
jgi:hypothetical protein